MSPHMHILHYLLQHLFLYAHCVCQVKNSMSGGIVVTFSLLASGGKLIIHPHLEEVLPEC